MTSNNPGVRRVLIEYLTGTYSFNTAWSLGPVFPIMEGFQPYSKLKVFYHVPGRNDEGDWGGGYIELQVSINQGAWQSLGSSGFDGGVMNYSAADIGTYNNTLLLDFKMPTIYSVQFRFFCKTYQSTYIINGSHDLNNISGTAPWHPKTSNLYQHYCHIIVEEFIGEE